VTERRRSNPQNVEHIIEFAGLLRPTVQVVIHSCDSQLHLKTREKGPFSESQLEPWLRFEFQVRSLNLKYNDVTSPICLKHNVISPDLQQIPCIFLLQNAGCRRWVSGHGLLKKFSAGV
jgi:hypothetical protein